MKNASAAASAPAPAPAGCGTWWRTCKAYARYIQIKYGVFGPLERTPFPTGTAIARRRFAYARIRGFWQFGVGVYVFKEGLGLDTYFFGKAFIPVKYLEKIEKLILPRIMVWHSSPEVKSPIIMLAALHEPLKKIMAENAANVSSHCPASPIPL